MPWKETCAMSERKEFIERYLCGEDSMSALCLEFGISRESGYKWVGRFKSEGLAGLADRSRAPLSHPNEISEDIQQSLLDLRRKHPNWGPEKLLLVFARAHPTARAPSRSSVARLLKVHGLVPSRRRRAKSSPTPTPLTDGSAEHSVWSIDYKGQFPLLGKRMCYPLTCCDHESRLLICCQGFTKIRGSSVRALLETVFKERGIPDVIRSDNGAPFASTGVGGLSRLSIWWIKLGIRPERIRPSHPEENGRHERMHRDLKAETTKGPRRTLASQQRLFDQFRKTFNEERPHQALGNDCPIDHYRAPNRSYPARLEEVCYPKADKTRVVCKAGFMRLCGDKIFVSRALAGECVGTVEIEDGLHEVYFGPVMIGTLNERLKGPLRLKRPGKK